MKNGSFAVFELVKSKICKEQVFLEFNFVNRWSLDKAGDWRIVVFTKGLFCRNGYPENELMLFFFLNINCFFRFYLIALHPNETLWRRVRVEPIMTDL